VSGAGAVYDLVAAVKDPELPVITIADLGVLRSVSEEDGHVTVTITPTYSGCPAMDAIRSDIRSALARAGHTDVEVHTVLSPAWSTDMITETGRAALASSGIAPPGPVQTLLPLPRLRQEPVCPRCGSERVTELSRYASTACQSLWKCDGCAEPFNAVKTL
jgi:ring-1,2-phenylacetyl-CoA epoxidase subunit PaaD